MSLAGLGGAFRIERAAESVGESFLEELRLKSSFQVCKREQSGLKVRWVETRRGGNCRQQKMEEPRWGKTWEVQGAMGRSSSVD